MKAVIQRVGRTALSVENKLISEISSGLAVYLGVKIGDTKAQAQAVAKRIAALRVFRDENGKMNKSVKDTGGEILLISQFTLYGDCSHGNRPSFTSAEHPEKAEPLYEYVAELLRSEGITVKQGVFGADMQIAQHNDGPVTIIYEV